jgi:hypothetical protein
MDIENKTLEILDLLDLVREKVLSPDEALPHILRLFKEGINSAYTCDCGQKAKMPICFDCFKKGLKRND